MVPPPADGIHFLDFVELDDHIHMLSWDESDPEPIVSYEIYERDFGTLDARCIQTSSRGCINTGGHC